MPGESISVDITARDNASRQIRSVGDAAAGTAVKLDIAAASMKVFSDSSIKAGKAASTSEAALRSHVAADKLYADAMRVASGETTKFTKLIHTMPGDLGKAATSAESAAGGMSGLAGAGGLTGGGMGAAIAAGVVLSPVLASLAVGAAGFGAAAYGVVKPIENAAQASGGLAKNMHTLDAEQQVVARGILGLGRQFGAFEAALKPTVLHDFAGGLKLAGTLLHEVQPVALSFGKALGGVLSQVNAMFASGEWQQFFGFMARTVGPDLKLTGSLFVSLANDLPPLVEALQPVAKSLLVTADALAKVIGVAEVLGPNALLSLNTQLGKTSTAVNDAHQHVSLFNEALDILAGPNLHAASHAESQLSEGFKILTGQEQGAAHGAYDFGAATAGAKTPVFNLAAATAKLNTDMTTLVGNLLTLQGDNVAWKQAMQAAETQLKSNSAGLEGNSKNALANKQAVIASTNAAIQFASQQLTLHKDIGGATVTIQDQIRFLQGLHDKSAFVRAELAALRREEQLLAAQRINQTVNVTGLGQWSVSQSLAPGAGHRRAAGGLIPGSGNSDSYPALLTPGELVVPKGMVAAGAADHLRGRLPGFAAGGIVPKYAGSVAGIDPWIQRNDAATIRLIDQSVAAATFAAIKAAVRAASQNAVGIAGPGGGAPSANAALARRMMPAWAGGAEWAAWNYVAMRESGWSQFARNPSSGAYGIPQALPPSKMGAAANPPQSNPAAQISWMVGYIKGRYGDPIGAAAHERAFNWYDKGGALPPGLSLAYNGTGRPEMVLPPSSGGAQRIVMEVQAGGGGQFEAMFAEMIRRYVRVRGGDIQKVFGRN